METIAKPVSELLDGKVIIRQTTQQLLHKSVAQAKYAI